MTKPFKLTWMSSYGASGWESWDFAAYDWRRPELYGEMAKILENRGGFEALILDDTPFLPTDRDSAVDAVTFGGRGILHDPTPLLSAVSFYTRNIGLVTTAATATWPPFMLARALGTLDHLTYGRAGWQVDTAFYDDLAESYGLVDEWAEADRYDRSDEFMAICRMLWESWEEDAVLFDRVNGRFADGSKVHESGFKGKFFDVRGPLTLPRPPQRNPVIAYSDMSPRGREFAATHADLVVVKASSALEAKEVTDDLRSRAIAHGRDPGELRIFIGIRPFVAATHEDAEVKRARLTSTPAARTDGGDVGEVMIMSGDPRAVAAQLCEAIDVSGADGITVCGVLAPTAVIKMTDSVIPILRAEGLVRTGYRYQNFKDNLFDDDFVGIATNLPGGIK